MRSARFVVRLLTPVTLLLLLAGIYLGLSRPTLVETPLGSIECMSAFGIGSTAGATEAGQAGCAALTSEREVWSVTLIAASLGLLAGLVWVTASGAGKPDGPPDAAAGWADYPGQPPVTRDPGTPPGEHG